MGKADTERLAEVYRLLHGAGRYETFTIEGDPAPKARPRFVNGVVTSSRPQRIAERDTGWELKNHVREPLRGNLAILCIFYRRTRRLVDVDNLVKHILDAANGICWEDDSQVTAQLGILEWDRARPRTVILIGEHQSSMIRKTERKKGRR